MRARQEAGGRRQEDYNLIFNPDLILELAVKAGCQSTITYNIRDFAMPASEAKEFAVRHVF
jgi:hypothetical protein